MLSSFTNDAAVYFLISSRERKGWDSRGTAEKEGWNRRKYIILVIIIIITIIIELAARRALRTPQLSQLVRDPCNCRKEEAGERRQ